MRIEAGRRAVVRVAVATLWSRPEAVRPADAPALAAVVDLPAWIAGLDHDQRLGDMVLSQLLLGEPVLVDEVRADGWARVVAPEQPAPALDARGYPGWLPAAHLAPAPEDDVRASVLVDARVTALRDAPEGPDALPGVAVATRLRVAGADRDGWRPVRTPQPRWARVADLAGPVPPAPLDVARRFLGLPYVWGGVSGYGVDCSALVHLAWRRTGVRLPRDAHEQARAATPVALGAERPGDLYFFARPGRAVHHVGIVTAASGPDGVRRMLHACYTQRRVVEEALPEARRATLVAAGRVPSAADAG